MILIHPLLFVFTYTFIFLVYWSLRSVSSRNKFLLLASYALYSTWDWKFLIILIISTIVDFFVAKCIENASEQKIKKRWLWVSVVFNVGLLSVFKYLDWFIASAAALATGLGYQVNPTSLNLILPIGLSFFTFQSLSYSIDVYRGKAEAEKHFFDFALYIAFFPQLVAGPIVRAAYFLPQIKRAKILANIDARKYLMLFVLGYLKKFCIADLIAEYFPSNPMELDVGEVWMYLISRPTYVYCDMSGYVDMAIATAGLLGFRIPQNFNFPYFARNMFEFWGRWHITVTKWFRDYIFRPLKSREDSKLSLLVRVMITLTIAGVWHGPHLNYLIWGIVHGLGMVICYIFVTNNLLYKILQPIRAPHFVGTVIGTVLTFLFWTYTLVITYQSSFEEGMYLYKTSLMLTELSLDSFNLRLVGAYVLMFLVHYISYKGYISEWWRKLHPYAFAAFLGFFSAGIFIVFFRVAFYSPFIYFQF